jgi:tetratricopeptide (TPR) repeat protein
VSEARRREADAAFRAGRDRLLEKRFEEAAAQLETAVRLDPNLALAHYGIGEANLALARPAVALAAFLACREAYRCLLDSPEGRAAAKAFHDEEARALRAEIDRLDKERFHRMGIKAKELNRDGGPSAGEAALEVNRLEARLAEVQEAARHAGAEPPAVALALGNAYFQTGALTEAEREFRQALAAVPEWGDAHHNLAVVLLATGRLEEAQAEVDRAEAAGVAVHPRLREELRRKRAEAGGAHP